MVYWWFDGGKWCFSGGVSAAVGGGVWNYEALDNLREGPGYFVDREKRENTQEKCVLV